jgi:hypothetical protein
VVMPRIKDSKTLAAAGADKEDGQRPTIVSAPAAASIRTDFGGALQEAEQDRFSGTCARDLEKTSLTSLKTMSIAAWPKSGSLDASQRRSTPPQND